MFLAEEPILRSMVAMLRGRQAPKCGRRNRLMPDFRFRLCELHDLYAILKIDEIRDRPTTLALVFSPTSKPSAVWLFPVDENLICILQSKDLCRPINVLKTTTKWFWVLNMSSFLWLDMCSNWLRYNNARQKFFFRSISAKHDRVLFERILLKEKITREWRDGWCPILLTMDQYACICASAKERSMLAQAYLIPSSEIIVMNTSYRQGWDREWIYVVVYVWKMRQLVLDFSCYAAA